jgi:hypothetical protein
MPITQTIITTIVKDQIKTELSQTNQKIDQLSKKTDDKFETVNKKLDHLTDLVVDLTGEVKKVYEDHVVLSEQVSQLTDRVEKVELAIS